MISFDIEHQVTPLASEQLLWVFEFATLQVEKLTRFAVTYVSIGKLQALKYF